jgi:hypothetical protein
VGKRNRKRDKLAAPESTYRDEAAGQVVVLRGSMTPATRRGYADTLHGNVLSQEDAWQRAVEFLFERLAVRWEVAGVSYDRQKELLMRFRMASQAERQWLRDRLREHCAEHFPDIETP